MSKSLIFSLIFNGSGIAFLIFILNRLWNEDKLLASCIWVGRKLSKWGRGKFGKSFWEPLETWIERRFDIIVTGIKTGADEDDKNNNFIAPVS